MEAAPAEASDDDPAGGAEPDLTPPANADGDGSDPATFPEVGAPDTPAGGPADTEREAPPSTPAYASVEAEAPHEAPAEATSPADRAVNPAEARPDQAAVLLQTDIGPIFIITSKPRVGERMFSLKNIVTCT